MTAMAENLRCLRKSKNLTQKELSNLSGVSCNSITNYETDRRTDPPVSVTIKLADALGVSIDQLARGQIHSAHDEEQEKMKLWDLMVVPRYDMAGTSEAEELKRFARKIRKPGTRIRHLIRNRGIHALVITDGDATADSIDAMWKREYGDVTLDDDAIMLGVKKINADTDIEAMAAYYGMNEDGLRNAIKEAYGAEAFSDVSKAMVEGLAEGKKSKAERFEELVNANARKDTTLITVSYETHESANDRQDQHVSG